jgi:hypothetical protein
MKPAGLAAVLAASLLAGCAAQPVRPAPETGWSRAPDLSVFSAMTLYGEVARTESSLCRGVSPMTIEHDWREDFGAREQAVVSALTARHGVEAVGAAEGAAAATRRVPCPDVLTFRWQYEYERLLHLLELRLGLA